MMTFKDDWEKNTIESVALPKTTLEGMIFQAKPSSKMVTFQPIIGGCSNLNFKIHLEDEQKSYILRIYLRDQGAIAREKQIYEILRDTVPVPNIVFVGENRGYHFTLTEFIEGITLRELLLSNSTCDLSDIMEKSGYMLSVISNHPWKLQNNINEPFALDDRGERYIQCIREDLSIIGNRLSVEKAKTIEKLFKTYASELPNEHKFIVHGDYDPSNILVTPTNNTWEISGILDWEFSFSGSMLWDVSNMLRYAHLMPSTFQEGFLKGLTNGGIILPSNWKRVIHLFNLISLVDCLKRFDPQTYPKRIADCHKLIDHILKELNNEDKTH